MSVPKSWTRMYIETTTGTIQEPIDKRMCKLWYYHTMQYYRTVRSKCTASKCKNIDKSYQHNIEWKIVSPRRYPLYKFKK